MDFERANNEGDDDGGMELEMETRIEEGEYGIKHGDDPAPPEEPPNPSDSDD